MTRVTQKILQNLVDEINLQEGFVLDELRYNTIGAIIIDYAYGGCQAQRISNVGGGVTSITYGYLPKKEVYNKLKGLLK